MLKGFSSAFTTRPRVTLCVPLVNNANKGIKARSSTVIMRNLTGDSLSTGGAFGRIAGRTIITLVGTAVVSLLMCACGFVQFNTATAIACSMSVDLFTMIVFTSVFNALIPVALRGLGVSPTVTAKPFVTVAGSVVNVVLCVKVAILLSWGRGGQGGVDGVM